MRAVAKIRTQNCGGGGEAAGSGFLHGDRRHLVTALGAVAGCSGPYQVSFERAANRIWRAVRVVRELALSDLALLALEADAETDPLALGGRLDAAQGYRAIGFAQNRSTMDALVAPLSPGLPRIADFLPSKDLTALSRFTAVPPTAVAMRFGSYLYPALSGGPIVDADGNVVGVVGGGLDFQSAPASWGWPAAGIAALRSSSEDVSAVSSLAGPPTALNAVRFSAAVPQEQHPTLRRAHLHFRRPAIVSADRGRRRRSHTTPIRGGAHHQAPGRDRRSDVRHRARAAGPGAASCRREPPVRRPAAA